MPRRGFNTLVEERADYAALWPALKAATEEQYAEWRRVSWNLGRLQPVAIGGYTWLYCENCQSWLPTAERWEGGPHGC